MTMPRRRGLVRKVLTLRRPVEPPVWEVATLRLAGEWGGRRWEWRGLEEGVRWESVFAYCCLPIC